jgi:antitoxin (DNA-binding transcriptional repressor) of toxin-antitoxin stability system
MKKARIAELKNRLSHYLRYVRRGQSVLVYDRDRAIARIDPVTDPGALEGGDWTTELERSGVLRAPARALPKDWLARRVGVKADVTGALLAERDSGR